MPDPLSHHPDMLIIRPDSMPRFWWLNPWRVCRQLHKNAVALRELSDRQDDLLNGKVHKRPRWSVFVSGLPGTERRYYFKDHDAEERGFRRHGDSVMIGETLLYDGPTKEFVCYKDPEDAIMHCKRLNNKEVQS